MLVVGEGKKLKDPYEWIITFGTYTLLVPNFINARTYSIARTKKGDTNVRVGIHHMLDKAWKNQS